MENRPVGRPDRTLTEEDRKALTIKQLCEQYIADMEAGLILGKGGRPKKDTTIATDVGRQHCRGGGKYQSSRDAPDIRRTRGSGDVAAATIL